MPKRIDLSSGDLNGAGRLLIEPIQPDNKPPIIAIVWPIKPSITTTTTSTPSLRRQCGCSQMPVSGWPS